jgi:RNA polymerase sigma-70 factor (ECF subfamily)
MVEPAGSNPATDEQLISACLAGDEAAMQQLFDRHHGRLYAMAVRMTGNRSDAEDVVQDAFVRAWRSLSGFRGDARFGTWIYRIAVNLCRDLAKRKKPVEEEVEGVSPPSQIDGIAQRQLTAALDRLSAGYREVLVLHDVMEMRHPEIAEILGVDVGTSKSQLHKARARMRELLQPAAV